MKHLQPATAMLTGTEGRVAGRARAVSVARGQYQ